MSLRDYIEKLASPSASDDQRWKALAVILGSFMAQKGIDVDYDPDKPEPETEVCSWWSVFGFFVFLALLGCLIYSLTHP